jgi:hypothetical protein
MIRWTPDEIQLLAKKFLEVRIQDMLAPVNQIIEKAQELAFPPERRRPNMQLSLMGWESQNAIKTVLVDFGRRMTEKAVAAPPVEVPREIPLPPTKVVAEMPAVKPPKVEEAPREPFIIEFRVPKATAKPDLNALLAEVPTPMLYGYALERMMKSGLGLTSVVAAPKNLPDVVRVEAQAVVPPPPEPVVIKADTVVDPAPSDDGRKRVLVLGLLPAAQQVAQDKSKNFLGLDITFVDSNTRALPAVVVDHVIVMRGVVNVYQVEQIKKRFATADRITHCEVSDEVMRKLADLNSRP